MSASDLAGLAPRALEGLVVADFSRALAGPLATMFLGDLGATVIKVERPGSGDDTRSWGPPYIGPLSAYFSSINRNKRSVVLDLDVESDRALALELTTRADVVIENFPAGKLASFGLDAGSLRKALPSLIYCSISGFGRHGGGGLPGYDFVIQAVGGLMSITGSPGGEPMKVGVALVDVLTGLHATIAILAALNERERTGIGQSVEVNLLSSLLASLVNQAAGYINGAGVPTALGNRHPSIAPYETLATGESLLVVAIGNDSQFSRFVEAIGLPELSQDARFQTNGQRVAHRAELVERLEGALKADSARNWATRLLTLGVPCGPVHDIREAINLASRLGLDPVATFASAGEQPTISTIASPLRFDRTPVRYERPPPLLGADNEEVRAWLASSNDPLS